MTSTNPTFNEQLPYKPTVYEQIVIDFWDGKELKYENYKKELSARGWKEKRYFDAYVKDIKFIRDLMTQPDFNLRKAADIVKKNHPSAKSDVLRFALNNKEKQAVLDAEQKGMFKDGEVVEYEGYNRKIEAHDYHNLPEKADAFVIFSGHPGSAEPAIEAWFEDYKRTGKAKKLVFLGLYDNQGNTDFSQDGLKFNTGSEVEMYVRYCREIGISEEIINECLVTPTDTSTEENTELLAEIRNKFFDKDKNVNFVMFGYPAYQKRIASEFAFQFEKMDREGLPNGEKLAPTNFIMPVVKAEHNEKNRYLSYDKLDGIAQDIIVGNCLAHPYRVSSGGRFDSKLGKYPEELKPLMSLSLVYSYPNVANELAGTPIEIATTMKLLRAVQHSAYEWENAKKVDNTIMYNNMMLRKNLVHRGLLTAKAVFHGNNQNKIDYLREITSAKKHNYADEAQVLLGSDKVNSRKAKGVIEYLKREQKGLKK